MSKHNFPFTSSDQTSLPHRRRPFRSGLLQDICVPADARWPAQDDAIAIANRFNKAALRSECASIFQTRSEVTLSSSPSLSASVSLWTRCGMYLLKGLFEQIRPL